MLCDAHVREEGAGLALARNVVHAGWGMLAHAVWSVELVEPLSHVCVCPLVHAAYTLNRCHMND